MKTREQVIEDLAKPFPKEAIKTRIGGGGKQLSYVEGHSIIRRLNEATDNRWSFEVLNYKIEAAQMIAHVRLHIPDLDHQGREHLGVQKLNDKAEDMVKGAVTDALKKAATLYGIGLDLYGENYETPRPPSSRAKLTALLKAQNIKNMEDANKASQEKFQLDIDKLSNEQVVEWVKALEATEPVPF